MYLRTALVLAALAGTGYLHGRWTDRWGPSAAIDEAATHFARLPLSFGPWVGRDITADESEVVYRSAGPKLVRRYVNRTDGTVVGVLVTCGRPSGMIVEHNPRVCYGDLGYEEPRAGRTVPVGVEGGPGAEFFAHTFVKTNAVQTSTLRLFWAWGDGASWTFPERPRVRFAHRPVLYKLYVTRDMLTADEPLAEDPALPFIRDLLPELNRALAGS